MSEEFSEARLTKIYLRIRNRREEAMGVAKRQDALWKEEQETVARMLLDKMGENTNVTNPFGSVRKVIKQKFWSTDWDSMRKFVVENNAVELIENRIQQSNMAAWLQNNPALQPPGLQIDRRYDVVVSKPRTKHDIPNDTTE